MSGGPDSWEELHPLTRGCALIGIGWLSIMGFLLAVGFILMAVWE